MKMVAKYYLAIRPQTNEHHAVHKEDCPFLPNDKKRIYLGMFGSGKDALKEGQKHFSRTNSCRFCIKEPQPERNKALFSGTDIDGNIPPDDQLSIYQEGSMFCFLN